MDKRLEPSPGLGGSLFHDQLLHIWLAAWGCPTWSREVFMGTPSIIASRRKKKNLKKKNSKKNKTKIFMGLGGANLEISLAQIELFSRQ